MHVCTTAPHTQKKKKKGIVKYSVDAYLCRTWFCPKGEKDREKKVKNSEIKSEREREVWEIWLLFNKYDSLGVLTHLHQNKIDSSLTARKGHLPSYVDWYYSLRAQTSVRQKLGSVFMCLGGGGGVFIQQKCDYVTETSDITFAYWVLFHMSA